MIKILKIFLSLLFAIFIIIGVSCTIFINLEQTKQSKLLTHLTNKIIDYTKSNITLEKIYLDRSSNTIIVQNISAKLTDLPISIPLIELKYNLKNLDADIKLHNIKIDKLKEGIDLRVHFKMYDLLRRKTFQAILAYGTQQGHCDFALSSDSIELKNCKLNIENSAIDINGHVSFDMQNILLHANVNNIPLQSYKFFKTLFPDFQEDFAMWDDFLQAGDISGKIMINIKDNASVDNQSMHGTFNIKNLRLKYDPDYPQLDQISITGTVKGNTLEGSISSGRSNKINFYDGKMKFIWQGKDKSICDIKFQAQGPSSSIQDFLTQQQILQLQGNGIDFAKTKGVLQGEMQLAIPTASDGKTTFASHGTLKKLNLPLYNNNIHLATNLEFTMTEQSLIAKGNGLINGYNSAIEYKQDFNTKITHLIAKIKLQDKNYKDDFINFTGSTLFKFEYIDNNDKAKIICSSDLTPIGLTVAKLNLKKEAGLPCLVTAIKDYNNQNFIFKTQGSEKFSLHGSFNIENQTLKLDNITTAQMQLSGQINFLPDIIYTKINAKFLDLSEYNLFEFFKKEKSREGIQLDGHFDEIKLKNEQILKKFDIKILCDQDKCYTGRAIGHNNNALISVFLNFINNKETWEIRTPDAGSLLKAVGVYNKINKGKMLLNISTERNSVEYGEILPITNGHLVIQNFEVTKSPILTHIISVTSITGLLNLLSSGRNLNFTRLSSDFSLQREVIDISELNVTGPFDLSAQGKITLHDRVINLKGAIVPSVYGINAALKNIPFLGRLFAGKRSGVIAAPFKIKDQY